MGHLAWMDTSCLLGSLYESRSLPCVKPHCPLQEPIRYLLSSSDWTQSWGVNMGWVQHPSWMKQHYFQEHLPDSYSRDTAGRGHKSQPMTFRLHCWEINDPVSTGTKDSCDRKFMTPQVQAVRPPVCWYVSSVIKESKSHVVPS